MNKFTILWICHFSQSEIREQLPLSIKIRNKYKDGGPWISNLAKAFEKCNDIELHIISPHRGLLKLNVNLKIRGVYYHFFKQDIPFIHRMWPSFFPLHKWTYYIFNRYIVQSYIKQIKPDIINLHGAENDYYSSTILGIRNIPTIITIQGIYSNPKRFTGQIKPDKLKINIERKIHKKFKYFGIFPAFFADLIKRDNDSPIFLYQPYLPNLSIEKPPTSEKKYDFVFFARISHVKGIEEILDALKIVRNEFPEVCLNIIGDESEKEYVAYLKQKINRQRLDKNVIFTGHLQTLSEVYKEVIKAKATVIASKFENLPDTIMESIMLNLTVITTDAGAIPILNKKENVVFISKVGDVQALAKNMIIVLKNPKLAEEMAIKARQYVMQEFSEEVILNRWIQQYKAVYNNHFYNEEIPPHLLFNKSYFENDS